MVTGSDMVPPCAWRRSRLPNEIHVTHETQTALRDRFLHKWARIMAGHVEDKDWLVLTGPRNCGKGVIIDLTIGTFAKHVGSTNAENFAVKRTDGDNQKAL